MLNVMILFHIEKWQRGESKTTTEWGNKKPVTMNTGNICHPWLLFRSMMSVPQPLRGSVGSYLAPPALSLARDPQNGLRVRAPAGRAALVGRLDLALCVL